MWGPTASGYVEPFYPRKRLSLAEVFTLFDAPMTAVEHLAAADNQDDLAIVTYLVAQSRRRS